MSGGGSGGNSYWPGFVDALTNVVIAMIFVVVVLAISLSFAAQMMAKKMAAEIVAKASATTTVSAAAQSGAAVPESNLGQRTRIPVAGPQQEQIVEGGKLSAPKNILQLDFEPTAVAMDDTATEALKMALAGAARSSAVSLVATGPAMGITTNQRSAYLRVLSVRNVLLQLGFEKDKLQMRIETAVEAPSPSVNISLVSPP